MKAAVAAWAAIGIAALAVMTWFGLTTPIEAQARRPYEVHKIPRGCLYVVGSPQTSLAVAFVPDAPGEPCHETRHEAR